MDPIRPEVEGGGPGAHANRRDWVEPPMERRSATGAEGTERSSRGLVLANKVPAIDDAQCASVSASKRSYYSCLSPRHHLWGGAHVAQAEGGPTYGNQGGEEAWPVSELDLAKALNLSASEAAQQRPGLRRHRAARRRSPPRR